MKLLGIGLVALAVVGLCAVEHYDRSMDAALRPLHCALPVSARRFTTSAFALEPGYQYRMMVSVDNTVPYADCLLGAGRWTLSADCTRHPSALDVAWSLRDDMGHVTAFGASGGESALFSYGGDEVEAAIGYVSVVRPTIVRLMLQFRRSALALAPLHPTVWIYDIDAIEGTGINELLFDLESVAVGIAGVILLVISRRR